MDEHDAKGPMEQIREECRQKLAERRDRARHSVELPSGESKAIQDLGFDEVASLDPVMREHVVGVAADAALAGRGFVKLLRDGDRVDKHIDRLEPLDIPAIRAQAEAEAEQDRRELEELERAAFFMRTSHDIARATGEEVDPQETLAQRLRRFGGGA